MTQPRILGEVETGNFRVCLTSYINGYFVRVWMRAMGNLEPNWHMFTLWDKDLDKYIDSETRLVISEWRRTVKVGEVLEQ